MRKLCILLLVVSTASFAQKKDKKPAVQQVEKQIIRQGNEFYKQNNFQDAEIQYKKALDVNPNYEKANYNLGNAIYQQDRFDEAVPRYDLVTKTTKDKTVKGENFHNIGNAMMKKKDYDKAINAYKNSLRNNPNDDETRYNLALAQKMRKKEADNKDDKKNKDDQNKNDKNKEDQNKENQDQNKNKDKSDQGDKNKDQKGNDNDKSKNQDQNDNQQQQQKPQPNKLSPQQIKQLLEAMNNEENKTQKKINAKKAKGRKVKQEKDW